jgi:ornithine carbamoyltransferase
MPHWPRPRERARPMLFASLSTHGLRTTMSAQHRDFLDIRDFSRDELVSLFALAERMRAGDYTARPLTGKALAMIFMKSSTRTRMSFEVGAAQLGGTAHFLSPRDVQLGRGEPVSDTARVLARYVQGIMIRTFAHSDVELLAETPMCPSSTGSPTCRTRARFSPMCSPSSSTSAPTPRAGGVDRRRQQHGQLVDRSGAAARLSAATRLSRGLRPRSAFLARARDAGADVQLLRDPREAVAGARVVTTDVWASMGQEEEQAARIAAFADFQVDAALMARAERDAIFLHCLPAHRGEEVTAEVIDGPQSRVWDEAENRLHIQKAIMAVLMGGEPL